MRYSEDLVVTTAGGPPAALDCIEGLSRAPSIESVAGAAITYFRRHGIENIVCGRIPAKGADPFRDIWFNDRPAAWTEEYVARGMLRSDPVLHEITATGRSVTWSEATRRRRLSRASRAVMGTARAFGMREGLTVPVYDTCGLAGVISLAGRELDLSAPTRAGLTSVAIALFHRIEALQAPSGGPQILTRREIEVLAWLADGKSDWQIGQILGVSAKTVNFHVENAKRKFGVATRIQAVVAAVRQGTIRY